MKISVDGKDLFELSETQKKVIKNDIPEEIFEEDMKRRIRYSLEHKYDRCLKRFKNEWLPRLKKAKVESIPLDDDKFAEFVFSRPEYKSRAAREVEIKNNDPRTKSESKKR